MKLSEQSKQEVNSKILVKSSFWYTIANFLTKAISFITIPIFTRIMSKQQYADFSVFASWQSIFLIVCGMEVYSTINRARFDYEKNELDSYITSCLVLSSLFTGLLLIVYICFPSFFDILFLLDQKYIYFMFAYLFTQPAFQMFQAKQRVEYKYKLSAGVSFSLIIISTVLAVCLVRSFDDKLMGRIIGQYLPYILVGTIVYAYFLVLGHNVTARNWKYALKLGLPLVFSYLGSQVLLSSDRVIVQHLGTDEEVAWLVLATSASHIILILVQTLNNAWAPWFFDKLRENCMGEIRKTFNIYMWLIVLCTLVVLLCGPEIVSILGGKEYANALYALPANMLCGVFTALTSQFVNLQTYYKQTKFAASLTLIIAVINIIGDIVGVMYFGYLAACYVTVLCQLLLIGFHYLVSRKFGIGDILPFKQLLYIIIVCLSLIPLSLFLYHVAVVRLTAILSLATIFCIVLYKNRKTVMAKIHDLRDK